MLSLNHRGGRGERGLNVWLGFGHFFGWPDGGVLWGCLDPESVYSVYHTRHVFFPLGSDLGVQMFPDLIYSLPVDKSS